MKKIIFAAAAALTLMAGAAQAQTSFGVEAGLNLSTLNGKSLGKDVNSGTMIGARVGGVADIGLTDAIYFRPGLQFSLMGGKNGDLGSDASVSINYIHIPLNVLYKLGEEGSGRIYFGLVPYLNIAVGGKQKIAGTSVDLKIGNDKIQDNLQRLDYGAGLKAGYELPMGFCVDLSYLFGFANLEPGGDADNKTSNRLFTIGASYFFGRDK